MPEEMLTMKEWKEWTAMHMELHLAQATTSALMTKRIGQLVMILDRLTKAANVGGKN